MILDPTCSKGVIQRALMHDIGEFATGDIPAQVKVGFPDLRIRLDAMEDEYTADILPAWDPVTVEEMKLVKTADALQLCFYALHEVIGGNHHYQIVFLRGVEYLRRVQWPNAAAAQVEEIILELETEYNVYRK